MVDLHTLNSCNTNLLYPLRYKVAVYEFYCDFLLPSLRSNWHEVLQRIFEFEGDLVAEKCVLEHFGSLLPARPVGVNSTTVILVAFVLQGFVYF